MEHVLCHCCLSPSKRPLPFACPRGYCGGSARYCSSECRDEDCAPGSGQHSTYRCRLLGKLRRQRDTEDGADKGGGVQIASCGRETVPKYAICVSKYLESPIDDDNMSWKSVESSMPVFEPTGEDIVLRIGDPGSIVLFPDQIDACGSVLVKTSFNEYSDTCYVLCDVGALCAQTSASVDELNSSLPTAMESSRLWMQGVEAWHNEKNYLDAIQNFEKSLDMITWLDDIGSKEKANGSTPAGSDEDEWAFHSFMLSPPPLRSDRQSHRSEIARRAYFLGACLLDADRVVEGRKWLMRSLKTTVPSRERPTTQSHQRLPEDCLQQNLAAMELSLSYEEAGSVAMARSVAAWTVEEGIGHWIDRYQRPGFLYNAVDRSDAHYSINDDRYPSWVHNLENHFDTILDEYTGHISNSQGTNGSCELGLPTHWPQVGSGEHRDSGYDDHRVVNIDRGGDWREHVLFGSGASRGSALEVAPKTRALIRKYAPDAVSLADSGGGEVIFSVLAPKTQISPHCASTNIKLTAHIGLVVPKDASDMTVDENGNRRPKCGIRVGDQWHTWQRGKTLVFDDSFEHEVINATDEVRAVLLLRFWNPMIPPNKREQIMNAMQQMKAMELKRRYNPPLPIGQEMAEGRGMGLSSCPRCFGSGHESMRVNRQSVLVCTCGAPIGS